MVGVAAELRPLAGFKVHHIGPLGGALMEQQLSCLLQGGRAEAEGLVALLAPGDGLENQVAGCSLAHRLHLGGDVGQHADLGGDGPVLLDLLEPAQDLSHLLR